MLCCCLWVAGQLMIVPFTNTSKSYEEAHERHLHHSKGARRVFPHLTCSLLDGAAGCATAPRPARRRATPRRRLADAHATGLPAGAADIVTVAQALHWLDLPRFYAEARRVLAPHGALAAWCYGLAVVEAEGHPADAALKGLYGGELDPYWDARRRKVCLLYTSRRG